MPSPFFKRNPQLFANRGGVLFNAQVASEAAMGLDPFGGYGPIQYNIPPSMTTAQNRYSQLPTVQDTYGKEPSFFDKFDPQALEDLAGLTPPERQQGKVLPAPGISRGNRHGRAGIPLSNEYDHTYAPNPGKALFVPEKEKNRFAGMS